MIQELSVVIPTYNCSCKELVCSLHQQLMTAPVTFEIVVVDDGSNDRSFIQENTSINQLEHCHYHIEERNRGRAGVRNYLAQLAQYDYLLFIDGDMKVRKDTFIHDYLIQDAADVCYGGYVIPDSYESLNNNLRYRYEKGNCYQRNAQLRSEQPNLDFHTSNFLVKRSIMLTLPLDERFTTYGYEDVLWGKTLKQQHITITHIDNPVSFEDFEDNAHFVEKTEESLKTLHLFKDELKDYSRLLNTPRSYQYIAKSLYPLFGKSLRKRLIYNKLPVFLFNIYKLMYLSQIK
jgi:glycosyltransferase involved in cell wall biosynthesis